VKRVAEEKEKQTGGMKQQAGFWIFSELFFCDIIRKFKRKGARPDFAIQNIGDNCGQNDMEMIYNTNI